MNFSQKIGIFSLIIITLAYIYFSFFMRTGLDFPQNNHKEKDKQEIASFPDDAIKPEQQEHEFQKHEFRTVKIFVTDSKGNLRSVSRKCDTTIQKSCFAYAIKELITAPTQWEKNKGLSSEIPAGTKVLSIREGSNNILIDFSPMFESGGGAESIYIRIHQLIKTVQANTNLPVFLYINGKQADVIGGEGIMIRQPLSEKSLND